MPNLMPPRRRRPRHAKPTCKAAGCHNEAASGGRLCNKHLLDVEKGKPVRVKTK